MKIFIGMVIGAIAVMLWSTLLLAILPRQERSECLKWQSDAKQYPLYYITAWQEAQCKVYKIKINAPVVTQ